MNLQIVQKHIFLTDGLGALLSAVALGILLPAIQSYIGMPLHILYILAAIALYFAIYSLSCHFVIQPKNSIWLKLIMGMNLLYCFFTLVLVFYCWSKITYLGIGYFFGESLVILTLVRIESQALANF